MIATLLLWILLLHESVAQEWLSDKNLETVRRPTFSEGAEDDIKDIFFRHIRTYEEATEDFDEPSDIFGELPQPGGFKIYQQRNRRITRDTSDANDTKKPENNYDVISQIEADVAKHLEKPELSTNSPKETDSSIEPSLNSPNDVGSENKVQNQQNAESEKEASVVGINDFIRFRRGLEQNSQGLSKEDKLKNTQEREQSVMVKHVGELADLNPFPEKRDGQQRTGRMLMQEDNIVSEGSREPRGATKEQWVKQPYPVHAVSVDDNTYEDSVPASTDVRAPRVHFVTQRRLEPAPLPVYRNFEREGRNRDFFRDPAREPSRNLAPRNPSLKTERDYFPAERPLKHYEPYPAPPYNPYREDPYYRYEESRYDPRYRPAEHDRDRPEYSNRQRRIIYYATLPEVVRSPPNVNLRDRYSYRDRYDDRYVTSPSLSVAEGNSYRYRKPYPITKSRYDQEIERTKAPYPLKVSTDVNVRETKKNPERRIYSESDRRYAYKTPSYQSDESFDHRT